MCSHYEAADLARTALAFGVELYEQSKLDLWPGYHGPFVRGTDNTDNQDESIPREKC